MGNISLVLILLGSAFAFGRHHRAPVIDLGGADDLVGWLREDQNIVSITPELTIVEGTGPICRYELSSETSTDIPFEFEITDKVTGKAKLKVKDGRHLDCSTPQNHLFVYAVRCEDSAKSESVSLRVTVRDTNDHAPEFPKPWYTFNVDEGKLYPEIARIQATDKDCGHPYGQICRYEITNALNGFPFVIDEQGVLRNTEPLDYNQAKVYILTVVAHDCGMQKSKSTLITVNVRKACKDGVRGVMERINYGAGSGAKRIAPEASIETCAQSKSCTVKSIESVVRLRLDHLTHGCDRNSIFSEHIHKKCGIHADTVVLLNDTNVSGKYDGTIGEVNLFNGISNSITVPEGIVRNPIPTRFTFSFSMQHNRDTEEELNTKQNILCESDDYGMSRHHFAVYIRHCKLEMLMRRESNAEAAFRPAEWRWSLPQVCDGRWHTYSILFASVDQVDLYVDGTRFLSSTDNPEILDDWPLHRTKTTRTRLVIGACWHGRTQTTSQYFKGRIAAMLYLPGKIEEPQSLSCVQQCKEMLQFNAMDELVPGEAAIFDNDSSVLTLRANTPEDLSLLLQKVVYINSLETPTPGHRTFDINTSVHCAEQKTLELLPSKGYIFVQKEADPVLSLSGVSVVNSEQHLVKTGAPMLAGIKITVTQNIDDEEIEKTSESMLDWCKVHLKPSRDMDLEYFSSPASLIASLHIDFEHDKQGILLQGKEKAKGYQEILSKIHYFNTRADSYAQRIYSVQCAMNDGRILSNELLVTMNIDAPVQTTTEPVEEIVVPDVEHQLDTSFDQIGSNRLQHILEMDLPRPKALLSHHGYDVGQRAVAGGAVAVVVVVCVGFLLVLLVIGVLKMRDTPIPRRRRRRNPEGAMEWDDSGMNITVNPLEDVEKNPNEFSGEEDSSDGGESYRDEEGLTDDEEDEGEQVLPHIQNGARQNSTGLEWDDTTLTNVSRTYRV